jgi:acyl-CoA dehydrogenase
MDSHELLDPFDKLLADVAAPARTREIEAGAPIAPLWEALQESGFLDALTPEDAGGVGLTLQDAAPLLQALGRHAVSAPVAETMVARALVARQGHGCPDGPIVLAPLHNLRSAVTPLARVATHALVQVEDQLVLAAISDAALQETGVHHSLAGSLVWNAAPSGPSIAAPSVGLRAIAATLRACAIAGATNRLLEMTTAYASDRVQFGKPIGKLQAIQQQLAVMAEHVVASRLASQLGCAGGLPPTLEAAAIAKQVTSIAAVPVAEIAHAVHGAIGVSEEYDLQLYTRRLHEWRLADGSESYWASKLGAARLAAADQSSVDFIRSAADGA